MVPTPQALALAICDYVVVEEGRRNVSHIGSFTAIRPPHLPFVRPLCAYAVLTGGQEEASVELTLTHMESDEEVYSLRSSVRLPDRLAEVRILFRVSECDFPEAGSYLFTLLIDGDWVAHRRINVRPPETLSWTLRLSRIGPIPKRSPRTVC